MNNLCPCQTYTNSMVSWLSLIGILCSSLTQVISTSWPLQLPWQHGHIIIHMPWKPMQRSRKHPENFVYGTCMLNKHTPWLECTSFKCFLQGFIIVSKIVNYIYLNSTKCQLDNKVTPNFILSYSMSKTSRN